MDRILPGPMEKGRFMEKKNSLCCCENLAGVGADCIYRTVMSLHLPSGCKGIHIPELEGASSAATEQNRSARYQAKSTHPVFMSIRNLLKKRRQASLMGLQKILGEQAQKGKNPKF